LRMALHRSMRSQPFALNIVFLGMRVFLFIHGGAKVTLAGLNIMIDVFNYGRKLFLSSKSASRIVLFFPRFALCYKEDNDPKDHDPTKKQRE
jgi:hypothetical protein